MKYMYCSNNMAIFAQFCSIFALFQAFYKAAKRVEDAIDNNQKALSETAKCGLARIPVDLTSYVKWPNFAGIVVISRIDGRSEMESDFLRIQWLRYSLFALMTSIKGV